MIAIQNKITGGLVGQDNEAMTGFDEYESVEAAQAALDLFTEVCGQEEVERLFRIVADVEQEIIDSVEAEGGFRFD